MLTNARDQAADQKGKNNKVEETQEDLSGEVEVHHFSRVQGGRCERFGREAQVRSEQDSSDNSHEQQRDLHRVATAAATTAPA